MSNELKHQDHPHQHHDESELERFGKAAMGWLEKNGMVVALGLAVVAVIAAIWIFWSRSAAATKAARWEPMITANDAERFAEIADEFKGSVVADWARLKESQRALTEGIQLSMTDREGSIAELTRARDVLKELLEDEDISDIIRERALYALGNTMETLAGVDVGEDGENVEGVEPAIEVYQRLVQTYPNSVFVEPAQKRIASLKSPETKDFYAWYRKQDPSPLDRPGPQDNRQPGSPSDFRPPASSDDGPVLPGATEDALKDFEKMLKEIEADKDAPSTPEEPNPASAEKPEQAESATDEEPPADTDGPALPTPDADEESSTEADAK